MRRECHIIHQSVKSDFCFIGLTMVRNRHVFLLRNPCNQSSYTFFLLKYNYFISVWSTLRIFINAQNEKVMNSLQKSTIKYPLLKMDFLCYKRGISGLALIAV